MVDFQLKPKKPRKQYDISEDTETIEKIRESTKGVPKPKRQGLAIRAIWQKRFIKQHPLNDGEIYIKYTNLRNPHMKEVILIGSDAHKIEISRDGENWKTIKKSNYHAKRKVL